MVIKCNCFIYHDFFLIDHVTWNFFGSCFGPPYVQILIPSLPLSNPSLYRRLVGSLVYLIVTRPDISYDVHQVSQYLSAPRSTHYIVVLHILRYLKGTPFQSLFYSAQSPLILRAFFDANWVGDPIDRRFTTGYCFLLGSSLISWRSKKQTQVAQSSTEAGYRALTDTTSELL